MAPEKQRFARECPRYVWFGACFAVLLLSARPAEAHRGPHAYCAARSVAGGLDVFLQVPPTQLRQKSEPREDVESHVRATTPSGECSLVVHGPVPGEPATNARFQLDFSCPDGPITLSTDYGMDVDASAEVLCAIDGRVHTFRSGALDYVVGAPPTVVRQLLEFVRLGVTHVFGGLDHVLFVLSLLLGAASASAADARGGLRRVIGIVSGFTLGHSITLAAAALGVVSLPTALTESAIALSIVVVAVHNLLEENPRGRGLTSSLFGLVHGLGFASALAAIGLPRRGTLASLLAFNVGIELAQLALVLAGFPALIWASRRPWFRKRLLVPACCAIAAVAALWFVKRAFGLASAPWLGA